MKKSWMLVLLVSLGLNLGLGYRLWQERSRVSEPFFRPVSVRGSGRPGFDKPDSLWRKNMAGRRLRHMTAALDLTPDQVFALQKVQQKRVDWIQRQGHQMDELRARMRAILGNPDADPALVRAAVHDMGRKQAELDSLVTETIMAELKVLDPSQRETYLHMLPIERPQFRGSSRGPSRGSHRGAWGGRRQ